MRVLDTHLKTTNLLQVVCVAELENLADFVIHKHFACPLLVPICLLHTPGQGDRDVEQRNGVRVCTILFAHTTLDVTCEPSCVQIGKLKEIAFHSKIIF